MNETFTSVVTDRRRFLLGTAALAGVPFLGIRAADAAEPVDGGTLKLGVNGTSSADSLDPATYNTVFMMMIGFAVRGNLVEVDAEGTLQPEIAAKWEGSDDAKTWRFKLQSGLAFSNGKPVTAADVIVSLDHHRGADSTSGGKAVLDIVDTMTAESSDTIVFTLKSGNISFPYNLSDTRLNIMPAKDGKADWASGIGAGPYTLANFEPGVSATLVRNKNSYKKAYLDTVELIAINDPAARQAALRSGSVDVINAVDPRTAKMIASSSIKVENTTGRMHPVFCLDASQAPYNDLNIRLALKHGIDRKAVLNTVFQGYGAIGNDQPITTNYPEYDASVVAAPYDADKAKFYMKKAGVNTIALPISTSDTAFIGAVDCAVVFQQSGTAAGLGVEVVREPGDSYWADVWMKRPCFMTYWGGRPTADMMLTTGYAADSNFNETRWKNARFNELLSMSRIERDKVKRTAQFNEMQRIISEDGAAIIPVFADHIHAIGPGVAHGPLSGNWELDGARLPMRWWKTA